MTRFLLFPLVCFLLPASFVLAENISKRELDQYMGIIGAVTAAQQTTLTLTRACSRAFPGMRLQSGKAITGWNRRNGSYVRQAQHLQKRVYAHLRKQGGPQRLRRFKKELQTFTRNERASVSKNLAKMKPKEKRYVCGQVLTSINAGKWDIETAYPAVHHALKNMEERK